MAPHPSFEKQSVRTLMLQTLRTLLQTGLNQDSAKARQAQVQGIRGFLQALELFAEEEGDQETLGMIHRLRALPLEQNRCSLRDASTDV